MKMKSSLNTFLPFAFCWIDFHRRWYFQILYCLLSDMGIEELIAPLQCSSTSDKKIYINNGLRWRLVELWFFHIHKEYFQYLPWWLSPMRTFGKYSFTVLKLIHRWFFWPSLMTLKLFYLILVNFVAVFSGHHENSFKTFTTWFNCTQNIFSKTFLISGPSSNILPINFFSTFFLWSVSFNCLTTYLYS